MKSSQISTATLPPELADRILDFLHDDVETLSNCSLVCQAWLPTSRFHLFATIAVHTKDAEAFETVLGEDASFENCIRQLTVHPAGSYPNSRFVTVLPTSLLQADRMMNLYRLEVTTMTLSSFAALLPMLYGRRQLRELVATISADGPEIPKTADRLPAPALASLRSLELSFTSITGHSHTAITTSLLASGMVARAETFALRLFGWWKFAFWAPVVAQASGTLRELRLHLHGVRDVEEHGALFVDMLPLCTSVRTLSIAFYSPARAVPYPTIAFLARALSLGALPPLERLVVNVHGSPLSFARDGGARWADVMCALADSARFPCFRVVQIDCFGGDWDGGENGENAEVAQARMVNEMRASLGAAGICMRLSWIPQVRGLTSL